MRTAIRPAKVGEMIVITFAVPTAEQLYKNGDLFVVKESDESGNVFVHDFDTIIALEEYEVVVDDKLVVYTKNYINNQKDNVKRLRKMLDFIDTAMETANIDENNFELEAYKKLEEASRHVRMAMEFHKSNIRRMEHLMNDSENISKKAREDIVTLKKNSRGKFLDFSGFTSSTCDLEFTVDLYSRTVTATIKAKDGKFVLTKKGVAKCSRKDSFDSNIGKAIALRRALDLEVPEEYLNGSH